MNRLFINLPINILSQAPAAAVTDLRNEAVQIGVGRAFYVERTPADITDCLVVKENSHISVPEECVDRTLSHGSTAEVET